MARNRENAYNNLIEWQLCYDTNERTHRTENCNKNKSVMVTWQLLENLSLNVYISARWVCYCGCLKENPNWILFLLRAFQMRFFHMFIPSRLGWISSFHCYLYYVYFWDELAFGWRVHLMWKFIQMVYLSRYNLIRFDFM